MGKNIICKKAIVRFNGSSEKIIKANLIKKQYPEGSTFTSIDDLDPIGSSIEDDFNARGIEKVINKFPKFNETLFDESELKVKKYSKK